MKAKDVSRALLLAAVAVAALCPAAQGQVAGALGPGDINAGASRVYVMVDKTGFGHPHAVVGRLREGRLAIAGRGAGRLVIDLRTFLADAPDARRYINLKGEIDAKTQQDVTATMLGEDVLDVRRFPLAVFDVDSFTPVEASRRSDKVQYRLDGAIKLHGVRRPLRFVAEGGPDRGYLHLKGNFHLRQSEFKMRPYQKALGAVGVADVLTVYGDIWIKQ